MTDDACGRATGRGGGAAAGTAGPAGASGGGAAGAGEAIALVVMIDAPEPGAGA
jgi:hypothetical protein